MAKELHSLPHVSTGGGLAGQDLMLIKKTVSGTPLDFRIDINSLFAGYLQDTDVGTEIGDLFVLVDDGLGNAGLPIISGNRLTNLNVPQASDVVEGAVTLSDAINGTEGVTNGFSATPKAVADLNALTFKKAGGDISGAVKFPNNVPLRWTLFGGGTIDVFNLDVNNDLYIGDTVIGPDEVKIHVSNAVSILNQAGTERFRFNDDGTSSGVRALDVSAAATGSLPVGTAASQLIYLNDNKLDLAGGIVTGDVTLANTIEIKGAKLVSGTSNLIKINASDEVEIGEVTGGAVNLLSSGGFVFKNAVGSTIFSIADDGSFGQLTAAQISYPNGTGGVTGADVQAAISWLGSNKIGTDGTGSISGSLTLDNNLAYRIKNGVGTSINVATLDDSDVVTLADRDHATVIEFNDLKFTNSLGTDTLTMTDTGFLSGVALHASTVNLTASGATVETTAQSAIYGLEGRKLTNTGGTMSGTLLLNNDTPLAAKIVAGTTTNLFRLNSADVFELGNVAVSTVQRATSYEWKNASNTTILSLTGDELQGTSLVADRVNFTPASGLTSTNVQDAINEVQANAISGEAAEFTGTINFANSIGITTRNTADTTNLSTIKVVSGDALQVGEGSVDRINLISGNGTKFLTAGGTTKFEINPDEDTLVGFSADKITSTATGSVVATTVQAAIAELANEKFDKAGGDIFATANMANNASWAVKDSGGTGRSAVYMATDDRMIFGSAGFPLVTRGSSVNFTNGLGATVLEITSGDVLQGSSLVASQVNTSVTGLTATKVEGALQELQDDKLASTGGGVSGDLTLDNLVALQVKNLGGTPIDVVSLFSGFDWLKLGNNSFAETHYHAGSGGHKFYHSNGSNILLHIRDSQIDGIRGTDVKLDAITGLIGAEGSVQTALTTLQSDVSGKLDTSGTATNSSQLGGVSSSLFARKDNSQTFTADQSIEADLTIGTLSTNRWLTMLGGENTADRTGFSIGEHGKYGSAAMHMYYTGDGAFHIGMGTMSSGTHASQRALQFNYQSKDILGFGRYNSADGFEWNGQSLDSRYLGAAAKALSAIDSDTLNGKSSSISESTNTIVSRDSVGVIAAAGITSSHTQVTHTSGDIGGVLVRNNANDGEIHGTSIANFKIAFGTAVNSDQLGGVAATSFSTTAQGDTRWLGLTAKAASSTTSDQLGGVVASSFSQKTATETLGFKTFDNGFSLPDNESMNFGTTGDALLAHLTADNSISMSLSNATSFNVKDAVGSVDKFRVWKSSGDVWMSRDLDVVRNLDVGGDIIAVGNITGTSDVRVKDNIENIQNALEGVRAIGGQTFDRTDIDCPRQMGVIAQIAENYFPEAVVTDKDGKKSVAYGNLAAGAGFAATDELAGIVETQAQELSELSIAFDVQADEVAELKAMVQALLEK